jgi:hypothetical protein
MTQISWEGRLAFVTGTLSPSMYVEQPDGDRPGEVRTYKVDACLFNRWLRENAYGQRPGTVREVCE